MAIYSCRISNISRNKGKSAVATAAYIEAKKMIDKRTGLKFNYGRQERVLATGVMLPKGAPERYKDSEILFNEIEMFEKAENARTAKSFIVAMPREFDLETDERVVQEYIRTNLTSKGFCAAYAIHCDKEGNNPHAHILVPNRALDSNGKWMTKCRKEYALDENGNRIPVIDPETGEQKVGARNRKQWKRVTVEVNPLDQKETLKQLRKSWADECNQYLDEANKIDHRSYEERGIDQIPTKHEGYAARQIEERGGKSEICQVNREIRKTNQQMKEVAKQENEIRKRIDQSEKEVEELYGILRRNQTGHTKDVIRKAERGINREKANDSFIKKLIAKTRTVINGARAIIADARTILGDARAIIGSAAGKTADSEAARRNREVERGKREITKRDADARRVEYRRMEGSIRTMREEIRDVGSGKKTEIENTRTSIEAAGSSETDRNVARRKRKFEQGKRESERRNAKVAETDCFFARRDREAEQREREAEQREREAEQGNAGKIVTNVETIISATGGSSENKEFDRGEGENAFDNSEIEIGEERTAIRDTRATLTHRRDERRAGIKVIQHMLENIKAAKELDKDNGIMESLNGEVKLEERSNLYGYSYFKLCYYVDGKEYGWYEYLALYAEECKKWSVPVEESLKEEVNEAVEAVKIEKKRQTIRKGSIPRR